MLIARRRGWEIAESRVTPEPLVIGRRTVTKGAIALATAASASRILPAAAASNPNYPAGRALTPEDAATSYNNFYEFGDGKDVTRPSQRLPTSPWLVVFAGMVAKPQKIGLEDLLKQVQVEERVYRHRCVETWAMTVPWTGFPLSQLLKVAQPTGSAKYVVFESATLPRVMPGLRNSLYPWPYVEGCTMQEAANDVAFIATGMYGHDLPKQDGAPIRLVLPWKYGFKCGKSIVKVTFTDQQPETFWHALQPAEYGFWANVNPAVPHPRWSQATERLLGSDERVPTQIWNGYGEWVAAMYADKQNERLFA